MEASNMSLLDGAVQSDELELETLLSIYVRELEVSRNKNGTVVSIKLHPATADKLEEQFVRMTLVFNLPKEYPDEIPEISVQNTRGLSDNTIEKIILNLKMEAGERKGSPMLFELIELAKECLTSDNKPHEECAICLYGFMEGDSFMKTECYHYFHCHCLSRYVEHKLRCKDDDDKDSKQTDKDENSSQKVPCPVCRLEIQFSELGQKFPEPIAVLAAPSVVEGLPWNSLKRYEKLYQKQLGQGGIIDLKVEDEKYLLEISSVNFVSSKTSKNSGKISNDSPTHAKSSKNGNSAESELDKQKKCSPSTDKLETSSSKASPQSFRPAKSESGFNEKDVETFQSKQSYTSKFKYDKSLPHYRKPNFDVSARVSKYNSSYKSEPRTGPNVSDDRDTISNNYKFNQRNVPNNTLRQDTYSQNNRFPSKAKFNRNYHTNYAPEKTYNRPFNNNIHSRQLNQNEYLNRERTSYEKYNTSQVNTVQSNTSKEIDDNTHHKDKQSHSFSAFHQNTSNRTYGYNKKDYNRQNQNRKFQGRKENYISARNEGQYRNNFSEENMDNGTSSLCYTREIQNERQKHSFPNSPRAHKQYPQFRHSTHHYNQNRHYNQNNHNPNNESKNIRHKGEYPKHDHEKSTDFPHYNKHNRKFENKHLEHSNESDNKDYNGSQTPFNAEENDEKCWDVNCTSSNQEKHRELESIENEVQLEKTRNDFSASVNNATVQSTSQNCTDNENNPRINAQSTDYSDLLSFSSSSSQSSTPLLPPGFANPLKKVIYGVPSFQISAPPGF